VLLLASFYFMFLLVCVYSFPLGAIGLGPDQTGSFSHDNVAAAGGSPSSVPFERVLLFSCFLP